MVSDKRLPREWRARTCAALAYALLLSACGGKEAGEEKPTVKVQVATAARTTLERKITGEAVLYPLDQAAIVPKLSAPVEKFLVQRGDRVRKGELLAVLEHSDLAAAVTENQGAYEQAQASYTIATIATVPQDLLKAELDLKAAKEGLGQAQYVYDSRQKLYAQGALAKKDFDVSAVALTQARNAYQQAQRVLEQLQSTGKAQEVKQAKGQLEAAKGKYLGAEAQLAYSEIRSPIDGVVTDRPLYPGEMVSAGTPLITVMNLSQVIARAHISQQLAALVRVGDTASISDPSLGGDLPGRVTIVGPALDPSSTTVQVWVQAANPGERLKAGTNVRLTIVAETVKDAIFVPAAAVITGSDGSTSVMVVDPSGKPHARSVKTGIRDGDKVQIRDGLQAGESVVTIGAFELAQEDPDVLERTTVEVQPAQVPDKGGN